MPLPSPSPGRVSIRDIARKIGVSTMTVSLALRNNPKISEPTRLRVREAATKLGYRPDPEIARLMTRLHGHRQAGDAPPMAIVDLSPMRLPAGTENYCELVRRGAIARAESLGYLATCFHQLDYEGDIPRLLKVLHYRGIRGILLLPPLQPVELPPSLDWTGFSVIVASYAVTPLIFHRVVPHQFIDMCCLLRLLAERGHTRIGAVFEENFEERTQFHFTAAIKLLGHGDHILRVKNQKDLSRPEIARWLKAIRPDAIVSPFALELRAALPAHVGDHPAPEVIGLRAVKDRGMSYWNERPEEIGSDAALLLAGMIEHNETGIPESPRTSLVHGVFHDASLPAAKSAPGPTQPAKPRPKARAPA